MRRLVTFLSAFAVLAFGVVFQTQPAVGAESVDPCFGGVVAKTDDSGKITGSDCTDVIVASERTTEIEGGSGDDVIIGAPNTVMISGGNGWDYIVGNSLSTVVFGDSGDDIIDAGTPPAPDELSPEVKFQIDLAASILPKAEAVGFRRAFDAELRKAHDEARSPIEPNFGFGKRRSTRTRWFKKPLAPQVAMSKRTINGYLKSNR